MVIYKITNKKNGKIYVGKTEKNIENRWKNHIRLAEKKVNRYLYDAMNHYGYDSFSVEIIEQCLDKEHLNIREIYWIAFYNATNPKIGYNMQTGGIGGTHNSETLKKIGRKVSIANKGHLVTEETRRKISKAHIGMKHTLETKKKLSEIVKASGHRPPVQYIRGKDHPRYGKTHTIETKRKMSEARLGKRYEDFLSPEQAQIQKQKRRLSWLGDKNPKFKPIDITILNEIAMGLLMIKKAAEITGLAKATIIDKFKRQFGVTLTEWRKYHNEDSSRSGG